MSRINTMARFNENVPDTKVVGQCVHCRGEVTEGDEVVHTLDGGNLVHRDDCWAKYCDENYAGASGYINARGEIE